MDYQAANEFMGKRLTMLTNKSSREIADSIPARVRAQCFFSSRVAQWHVAKKLKEASDAVAHGELSVDEARVRLERWLDANQIGDKTSTRISNISSAGRLNLILTQNAKMAAAVGRYQVSRDPDIEERWPSWRYIAGHNPRHTHSVHDGKVYRKSDPFWTTHYPPWDFGCNCDVEDSDETPMTAPKDDGKPPESGFAFDPADAFGTFDLSSVTDPDVRAEIARGLRDNFGASISADGMSAEMPATPTEKETHEAHLARRHGQLSRALQNRRNREAGFVGAEPIGQKHTIEQDASATNPSRGYGIGYVTNCQRCVTAYEMRRRGIDVEALPKPHNDQLNKGNNWLSVYDNPKPVSISAWRSKKEVEKIMREHGDGARAVVKIQWSRTQGHVFIAEQRDGKTVYIDPQSSTRVAGDYFAKGFGVEVTRVDNLKINANVQACCKPRGKK